MEGVSTKVYHRLKGYWRRRGYQKLNRRNRVELSAEGSIRKKRRFWKIKLTPKLKLKINFKQFSLKKLLVRLRDAYVNTMLRVANTRGFSCGYGGAVDGFGMGSIKEYDEKVLVEIYKSMIIAQGKLGTRDVAASTAKIGPEITVNGN